MIHELKTSPQYFEAIWHNEKNFEVRKNDRNFQLHDTLVLKEYTENDYTGREVVCIIKYILTDFDCLADGYVVLGLTEVFRYGKYL